jgi:hypothetical protein
MGGPWEQIAKGWRAFEHVDQAWTFLGYVGAQGWLAAAISSSLVWTIGMLTEVPWVHALTCAAVVFAAMIVASYHWERRRAWHDKRLPESEHSKSVDDNWIALIAILSKYVNDLTHLNLFFADLRQLRLAQTVGDVFARALGQHR